MKNILIKALFNELVKRGKDSINAQLLLLIQAYPELGPKIFRFQQQLAELKEVTTEKVTELWNKINDFDEADEQPQNETEPEYEVRFINLTELLKKGQSLGDALRKDNEDVDDDFLRNLFESLGKSEPIEATETVKGPQPGYVHIDEIETVYANEPNIKVRKNGQITTLLINVAGIEKDQITVAREGDILSVETDASTLGNVHDYVFAVNGYNVDNIQLLHGVLAVNFTTAVQFITING